MARCLKCPVVRHFKFQNTHKNLTILHGPELEVACLDTYFQDMTYFEFRSKIIYSNKRIDLLNSRWQLLKSNDFRSVKGSHPHGDDPNVTFDKLISGKMTKSLPTYILCRLRFLYGAVELTDYQIYSGYTADSSLVYIEDYICKWQSTNRRQL